jgi:hypothetical protein
MRFLRFTAVHSYLHAPNRPASSTNPLFKAESDVLILSGNPYIRTVSGNSHLGKQCLGASAALWRFQVGMNAESGHWKTNTVLTLRYCYGLTSSLEYDLITLFGSSQALPRYITYVRTRLTSNGRSLRSNCVMTEALLASWILAGWTSTYPSHEYQTCCAHLADLTALRGP